MGYLLCLSLVSHAFVHEAMDSSCGSCDCACVCVNVCAAEGGRQAGRQDGRRADVQAGGRAVRPPVKLHLGWAGLGLLSWLAGEAATRQSGVTMK